MKTCRQLIPALLLILLPMSGFTASMDIIDKFDLEVKLWAEECRDDAVKQIDLLVSSGKLMVPQLFDTFYIPISDTNPQKFHTQYDRMFDGVITPIIDRYLAMDERLIFVVLVDKNGYLPTHNSKYSRPMTGDSENDTKWNRTKRMFNDRTGLAAARNTKSYLMQRYSRDTGEEMGDLSVPIILYDRHWGAVRIGYKR